MSNNTHVLESGPAAGLPGKSYVQHADEAPVVSLTPNDATRFMFSGMDGHPDFLDMRSLRGDSPPLHRHPWASLELIVEGRIRFVVDGETFVAEAGDFVYTAPNAAHTYLVESDTARIVGFNHPNPRFYDLQTQAAPLFSAPGGPDMQRIAQIAAEHNVEVLGPPLQLES